MKTTKSVKKWMAIVPLALMSITMAGTPALITPVHASSAAQAFSDVPAKHWAYDAVGKLAKAGIVSGYNDNTFKGDKTLTRYEFAFIVSKAMDKFDAADDANKQLIDKLSAEFASELNRLGTRVAKVEAKTNTWIAGETRFRAFGNDPKAAGTSKLKGSNNFDFRQRIKFQGTINEDISWMARIQASSNFGNYNNNEGSNAAFDMLAVTAKNVMGIDKVRIGRFPYDNLTHGLFGKAVGVDGIRIDENIGKVTFTGSVNNIKGNGPTTSVVNSNGASTGDANTLTTAQLTGKVNNNLGWKAGYYWSEVPGSSNPQGKGSMNTNIGSFDKSAGWAVGFDAKLGKVMLIGDYVSTDLKGASNLPTSPKGWAVELSSGVDKIPAFYSVKNLVDYKKKGDFGWSVAYRSIDAGAIPSGAGGFDSQAMAYPSDSFSTFTKGTDNLKGVWVALQSTVSKNVIWTIEAQDLKFKNRNLTGQASDDLNKTYMTKLEFFY
ncbi:S-layer homology domain-containing protein [Sporomusa malonica]|uniref:Cyanobacterial porin n=1 Tax=Sporomusa malonica TaxID=112901 RepID=A0A1W1ZGR5_9FIRM|nr:S-layer homology domain-containing protein [Sporomusa malonica]SMC47251.1 cyanobacterial porin [Sporomusa malonica]